MKAKNVEAICDNYDSSIYQDKNVQSTANKVCFPESGAKHEIESKPLKNQNCITISVSEDEMPKKKQQKTLWITDDTLQSLSKFQENIRDKESKRVDMINIKEKKFITSLEEWKNMVANRLTHSFNNNFYVQILLSNFKQIYNRCVPCIQYHYLRHPDQVLSIRNSESSYFEGYV